MAAFLVGLVQLLHHVRGHDLRLPDALQPPRHANDLTLEREWDIQVATVGNDHVKWLHRDHQSWPHPDRCDDRLMGC
jgi:hypothetical protein